MLVMFRLKEIKRNFLSEDAGKTLELWYNRLKDEPFALPKTRAELLGFVPIALSTPQNETGNDENER